MFWCHSHLCSRDHGVPEWYPGITHEVCFLTLETLPSPFPLQRLWREGDPNLPLGQRKSSSPASAQRGPPRPSWSVAGSVGSHWGPQTVPQTAPNAQPGDRVWPGSRATGQSKGWQGVGAQPLALLSDPPAGLVYPTPLSWAPPVVSCAQPDSACLAFPGRARRQPVSWAPDGLVHSQEDIGDRPAGQGLRAPPCLKVRDPFKLLV